MIDQVWWQAITDELLFLTRSLIHVYIIGRSLVKNTILLNDPRMYNIGSSSVKNTILLNDPHIYNKFLFCQKHFHWMVLVYIIGYSSVKKTILLNGPRTLNWVLPSQFFLLNDANDFRIISF